MTVPQQISPTEASQDHLESLLDATLGPAYSFALGLTWNEADAEDLLQEAALRACRSFDQFEIGTNFRAWLFRILANCHKNRLRYDRRRGTSVDIDDAPPLHLFTRSAEAGLHDIESDPAAAFVARMGTDQIMEALHGLPDAYRTVALLYFAEDFSYLEIAEVLGTPIGTVRSRLHRARRMLQKVLWDMAVGYGLVPSESDG